jgi:hypothetical protein
MTWDRSATLAQGLFTFQFLTILGGALFLGGIEVAVGAGYYDVAQSIAARHAAWEAGLGGDARFFLIR